MSTTTLIQDIEAALPTATLLQKQRMIELLRKKHAAELTDKRELLEHDLGAFVREAWKFLNPGRELVWSWHYDFLCEHLMLVKQRKLRRLIINIPPRTAKSTIATMCFPDWVWTTEPSHAFLCASYSNSLSTDHSVARRNLLQSPWYQALWGEKFQLSEDRNLTTQFSNDCMGQMVATSTGSGAEGRGGDTAILDDPMSNQQALSDVERLAANRWVDGTLKQRLNDPATAAIIVIMQRLHEMDTTGFLLNQEKSNWTHIELPLEAEKKEHWVFPISGKVVEREKGDILGATRFPPVIVEEKKRNRMVWAGQYQQHPAPLEGNLIKDKDIKYYGGKDPLTGAADEELPLDFDFVVISADCAFKDLDSCDFVAVGAIGIKGRKRYVLNVINEHLDIDGTENVIRQERAKCQQLNPPRHVSAVLVEDKANGPAVITRLKKNVTGVIEVNPQGGKVSRMFAASPEWQAGDWYVDRNAAWRDPFVNQLKMFPNAAYDDMVDMMTQTAIWLSERTSLDVWSRL